MPGDWTISAKEGMYMLSVSISRTLSCKLDTANGFILPNTIDESHSKDNYVGIATDIEGSML
jgi:hypothetical protein